MSLTFFSIFINDIVDGLKGLHLGINFAESQIFALTWAEDIDHIADFSCVM